MGRNGGWAAAALAAVAAAGAAGLAGEEPAAPALPRSVVLVVGDGTGWQQWGLLVAVRRAAGERGKTAFHRLADRGVVGCATTFAADSLVTDSAAAATALASGAKTRNGMVGLDPDGSPLPSCLEAAAKRGLWTGIVTTTAVTDATPAAFTARVPSRRLMAQVAEQQVRERDLRVILGGGTQYFVPRSRSCAEAGTPGRGIPDGPSRRGDDADLLAEARAKGFTVVTNRAALLEGPAPDRLLGLFAPFDLPYALDRDAPDEAEAPTLAEMTSRALEVLGKSEKGFFLVVEGARVDHGCHHNDAGATLGELAELDAALEVILGEAERRRDLLVVVTADHEAGSLGVCAPKGEALTGERLLRLRAQRRSLAAAAAGAKGGLPSLDAARTAVPWLPDGAAARTDPAADGRGPFLGRHRVPFGDAASAEAGVVFGTDGHSAAPVPVVAAGPGAGRFAGLRDNTEIGRALLDLAEGR
jgi:alkaline phosphatase